MKALILGFVAACLAAPALAGPCDQFSEPLAYNACLARQGPAARAVHVGAAPQQATTSAKGRKSFGRVRGRLVFPRAHGRSEMVFTPRR